MDCSQIKERIKSVRKSKGLTQETMAKSLGISVNSYREIESGRTKLINSKLFKICDILEISPGKLMMGELSREEYIREIRQLKSTHKEEIAKLEHNYKIKVAELEGEINVLKINLQTKNSIIGVLKEESQKRY
jgi:transcriptional regulator with XRE-family HTH domain